MIVDNKKYPNTRMGYLQWKKYMNAFGWGTDLDIDLPGEMTATFPIHRDITGILEDPGGTVVTLLPWGIGQDRMLVTPLQMANAMCIIANKGYYYTPHFVDSIEYETIADTQFLGKFRTKREALTHISDSSYNAVQIRHA
jgi:penicillin-binding protein 2